MPFFAYKARNSHGELIEGVMEGADSDWVAKQLFTIGISPVQIVLTKQTSGSQELTWWQRLWDKKVQALDVQLFSRQLHTLIRAGVPIMRGLTGLQESAVSRAFREVPICVNHLIRDGNCPLQCGVIHMCFRCFLLAWSKSVK